MDSGLRKRKSRLAVNLGLGSNIALAILKTTFGILGKSSALLAEGVNSVSDIVYYVVVRVFIGLAEEPPDREHPYGHRQFETIAAIVVGAFVVTTGIVIFWSSFGRFLVLLNEGGGERALPITLFIALATVVFKVFMTYYTRAIARTTKNAAVGALARDHRNDVFSALAATIGILLSRLGLLWVDPLAGAVVSVVIFLTGIQIVRDSSSEMMDTFPGEEVEESIRDYVLSVEHVQRIDEIHAHRIGPYLIIYLTIGVDGTITVREGDDIATKVESILESEIEYVRRVHIHYHPGDRSVE